MDLRRVRGWPLLLGLTMLPLLSNAAGKCERLVVTGSPDAPPYLWQDPQNPKKLIGASADLLQHVAGELGIKVELLYAGKRSQALDEVRSGRMDLSANWKPWITFIRRCWKTTTWSGPARIRH
jgi:ABC-type amino acid transport substrate-binding protein